LTLSLLSPYNVSYPRPENEMYGVVVTLRVRRDGLESVCLIAGDGEAESLAHAHRSR